jgi:hypothetical protein
MDDHKVKAILDWKPPKSVLDSQVRFHFGNYIYARVSNVWSLG